MAKSLPTQIKRSSTANSVPDANVLAVGELAVNFADRKLYTKNGSNAVVTVAQPQWAYTDEFHVDGANGVDAASQSGGEGAPWKTITYALSRMASSGQILVIHEGVYSEAVTVNKTNIDIRSNGGGGGLTQCTGNWTFSHTTSSVRVQNISWTNAVTIAITGAGSVYFRNCIHSGAVTKSGGGYVQIDNSDFAGTGFSVTGAGTVLSQNSQINLPVINNASAIFSVLGSAGIVSPTVTSGIGLLDGAYVFSTAANTAAVTSGAAGIVYSYNSHFVTPTNVVARVALSGPWSINDTQYDRANSTLTGNNLGTVNHFDTLQVVGNVTVGGQTSLGAVGNVKITGGSNSQVLTTDGAGNLSWQAISSSNTGSNAKYVSKNGNDTSGDGSMLKPYLTITAAMNSISDAAPTKRYAIYVNAGEYNEGATLSLKPNVFVVGCETFAVRIVATTFNMNAGSWTGTSDHRSGFSNCLMIGACDWNWSTVTSGAGKLYFYNVQFSGPGTVNLYGYNNATAQAQFWSCVFFGAMTVSGINIGAHMNCRHYANITLNQHPGGGMATILNASGGDCGTVTLTTTVSDFNRRCSLFAKSFYMGGLTVDGASSYADVTNDSLPAAGPTILNGGNIVYLNSSGATTTLNNLAFPTAVNNPIMPATTQATNFGDWGKEWNWTFSYIYASTGSDLYVISYGNAFAPDTVGRNIGIYTDGAGLAANVNSGSIELYTSDVTGNGNSGNIGLTAGTVVSGTRGNINITGNTVNITGDVTVSARSNLGPVGNVTITGGSNGQVLSTNGSGNLSWTSLPSANYAEFSNVANTANSVAGANVSGQVGNALVAGTVYTNAQSNITSVGTLTGLTSNGTINFTGASNVSLGAVGNVKITGGSNGQVLSTNGSGVLSWATPSSGSTSNIANGTSNVSIPSASGNVLISSAGNANVVVVTGDRAIVNGQLTVSSTVTLGNVSVPSTLFMGGAGQLTVQNGNISVGNRLDVTGNASILQSLTINNGNLSVLTGNISATNGNISSKNLTVANGISNLGPVGNVIITGGSNGQVLTTNGSGGLSWAAGGGGNVSEIRLGNSFVKVEAAANGNNYGFVTISTNAQNSGNTVTINTDGQLFVNGVAESVAGIGTTGGVTAGGNLRANHIAQITGTANIGGNLIAGRITSNTTVNATGSITGANFNGPGGANAILQSGNSNITIESNGNMIFYTAGSLTSRLSLGSNGANVGGNFQVNGIADLGPVGNIRIANGTVGQFLRTDGAGNLTWATPSLGVSTWALSTRTSGNVSYNGGSWSSGVDMNLGTTTFQNTSNNITYGTQVSNGLRIEAKASSATYLITAYINLSRVDVYDPSANLTFNWVDASNNILATSIPLIVRDQWAPTYATTFERYGTCSAIVTVSGSAQSFKLRVTSNPANVNWVIDVGTGLTVTEI